MLFNIKKERLICNIYTYWITLFTYNLWPFYFNYFWDIGNITLINYRLIMLVYFLRSWYAKYKTKEYSISVQYLKKK